MKSLYNNFKNKASEMFKFIKNGRTNKQIVNYLKTILIDKELTKLSNVYDFSAFNILDNFFTEQDLSTYILILIDFG